MLLVICVVGTLAAFSVSPALGAIAVIISSYFIFGSAKRTRYMTNAEVDIANNLHKIKDPDERKRVKAEIQANIDRRIANKEKPPLI